MDRINHPTATAERTFTGGNPAANIQATVVTPEFMTLLQEEVVNVILAAGMELDPETDTQLRQAIAALIANAMLAGTTPPQFDTTKKVATAEFVQRALGNLKGAVYPTGAISLTAAQCGSFVACTGTTYDITMPDVTTTPAGGAVLIKAGAVSGVVTVKAYGANIINVNTGTVTSFQMRAGDSALIVSVAGSWYLVDGSVSLGFSNAFDALHSASGCQLSPQGADGKRTVVQWGQIATSAAGYTNITFPFAFPNAMHSIAGSIDASTALCYGINFNNTARTTTTIPVAAVTPAGAYIAAGLRWIAVGN